MANFVDTYQVPVLKHDQINHLNSPISTEKKKVVNNSLTTAAAAAAKTTTSSSTTTTTRTSKAQHKMGLWGILSDLQRRPTTDTFQTIRQNRKTKNITQLILCSHSNVYT